MVIIIDFKKRERSPVLSVPKHQSAPFPPSRRPPLPPGSCGSQAGHGAAPGLSSCARHPARCLRGRLSCDAIFVHLNPPQWWGTRTMWCVCPTAISTEHRVGRRGGRRKRETLWIRERFRTGRESGKELRKSHCKPKILRRKITQIREISAQRLPPLPFLSFPSPTPPPQLREFPAAAAGERSDTDRG